jgi:DNA-binding MarR family transcriptional regulator
VHPIFFSFKRAYWSSMRFSRDWAEEYEMTPARLDMLVAIARHPGGIAQLELRNTLDVCPPVVTRMLKALDECGLVQRWIHPEDRRQRWITLTERARRLLTIAVDELFLEGITEDFVRRLVAPHASRRSLVDRAMRRIREILRKQRPMLTDVAALTYPGYLPDGARAPDQPVSHARFTRSPPRARPRREPLQSTSSPPS